jgi:hypothetical protein
MRTDGFLYQLPLWSVPHRGSFGHLHARVSELKPLFFADPASLISGQPDAIRVQVSKYPSGSDDSIESP